MHTATTPRIGWSIAVIAATLLTLSAIMVGQAKADFGLVPGSFAASATSLQAGAHSDVSTTFAFNSHEADFGPTDLLPDEDVRDIIVNLPAGLVGNPQAAPQCTSAQLGVENFCPPDTQVGVINLRANDFFSATDFELPVYNMTPANGHVAEFAFLVVSAQVHIVVSVRTGDDYGITATIPNISTLLPVLSASLTLWGVPADASHDANRFNPATFGFGLASTAPRRPFMSNPTQCGVPGTTSITADSWQQPGRYFVPIQSVPQEVTGCDRVAFEPSITLRPALAQAGAPSGYNVHLHFQQADNPDALANATLKKTVVRLPVGMVVSPSAAAGLGACTSDEVGISSARAANCPDPSKIGTVEIDTPLLGAPLNGTIYLAQPTPTQLLKLYLVAEGLGVVVKLAGVVDADPVTGQLTATFDDNPQLPFTDLELNFKGGSRAPLANPSTCGVNTTTAQLTAYSSSVPTTVTDAFDTTAGTGGSACAPAGFSPSFQAGSVNPHGGAYSDFTLGFGRSDSDQTLQSISANLPPGLLGRIGSVPLCAESQASAGTCSEVSRVGSATTAVGPGATPFNLPGGVYITNGYKGAPFGLSIVVPAIAGPFDLGIVVVRAAIYVDAVTAAIRVVSDPLPTILQGIPLQIRSVNVTLDRSGFMFNPTNCNPMSVKGAISSTVGTVASVSSRFQVGDCANLPYAPKLAVTIGRKGHTGARATVPLTATLTQGKGEANNKVVQLLLPGTLNARLGPVRNACTMAAFDAGTCGSKARVGDSSAVTPLLRDPLKGAVYFVKNPRRGALPFLMVALRGQVAVNLRGVITTPHAVLQTRFETIPDVPITRFRLTLSDTSANGPVGAVSNLCTAANKAAQASLAFRGQNGALVKTSQRLKINGCATAKPASKKAAK